MTSHCLQPWLRFLILLFVLLLATVATADPILPTIPSFSQAGVNDAAAGSPETGSNAAATSLASASVDPSTGIATAGVPLSLPRARGHAQPRVSVSYSSVGGQGFAGWGWTVSFPEIERTTLSGPPTYNDHLSAATPSDDRFAFNGQPLVPICQVSQCDLGRNTGGVSQFPSSVPPGSWYFRLENDTLHALFFWLPSTLTWLVEFPSGETLEIGEPLEVMWEEMDESTIDFDFTKTQTPPYRWYASRQYDAQRTSGGAIANPIVYVWSKVDIYRRSAIRSYLTDVFDTLPPSSSGRAIPSFAHHLHLSYEPPSTPDPGVADPPIWRVTPVQRLAGVDVTSATFAGSGPRQQVRRYHLGYTEYNNRSYLTTVTLEGRCDPAPAEDPTTNELPATTNCSTLPPTQFGYQLPPMAPLAVSIFGTVPDSSTILDVNADGIPDFVGPGPSTQFLALNGAGAAANVVTQANIGIQSNYNCVFATPTTSNFSPVASPGSFSGSSSKAGVVVHAA